MINFKKYLTENRAGNLSSIFKKYPSFKTFMRKYNISPNSEIAHFSHMNNFKDIKKKYDKMSMNNTTVFVFGGAHGEWIKEYWNYDNAMKAGHAQDIYLISLDSKTSKKRRKRGTIQYELKRIKEGRKEVNAEAFLLLVKTRNLRNGAIEDVKDIIGRDKKISIEDAQYILKRYK